MKTLIFLGALFSFSLAHASEKVCFGIADRRGERLLLEVAEKSLVVSPQTELGNASAGKFTSTGHVVHSQSGVNFLQYYGGSSSECGSLFYLADEALLSDGGKGKLKIVCRSNTESYFCRDSR